MVKREKPTKALLGQLFDFRQQTLAASRGQRGVGRPNRYFMEIFIQRENSVLAPH
jgi:hypothetical protein